MKKRRRQWLGESLESRKLLAADGLAPLAGDWNGDGTDETGLFAMNRSQILIRAKNNPGFPDEVIQVDPGHIASVALVGDWNGDGRDSIGFYSPQSHEFSLQDDLDNEETSRFAFEGLTALGAVPLAGDWDGDNIDTPALWDANALSFYFTNDTGEPSPIDLPIFLPAWVEPESFESNWLPFAGDWNGNGRDTLGIFNPSTGDVFLQTELGSSLVETGLRVSSTADLVPIVGTWTSDSDSLGFYNMAHGSFSLKHSPVPGSFDTEFYVVPFASETSGSAQVDQWQRAAEPLEFELVVNRSEGEIGTDRVEDVDQDGMVTLFDAMLVVSVLRDTSNEGESNSELWRRSDVNGSGTLTITDALQVVQAVRQSRPPANTTVVSEAEPGLDTQGEHECDDNGIQLTACEVKTLLKRAAAASASDDAIISIVDREGRILGVRAEQGVLNQYDANNNGMIDAGFEEELLVFAIDGSLAKARTAAFFANGDVDEHGNQIAGVGPLTSRTVRFISQSTVTQRELESNPNILDLDSRYRGPGFVAPGGLGGHFPPDVRNTPPVDLFGIEHQSRDSIVHPGEDLLKGTLDDKELYSRFNVNPMHIPAGKELDPPESYGFASGRMPHAQSRGIGTLPGGMPIYRFVGDAAAVIGGIGVFFPGPDGYATHEQNYVTGIHQPTIERLNAPKVLEAEWIAYAAVGGAPGGQAFLELNQPTEVGSLNGVDRIDTIGLPFGRIDLVGITLEVYGPHPTRGNPQPGVVTLLNVGQQVGLGDPHSGVDQPVSADNKKHLPGEPVPEGWLVMPHDSDVDDISAEDVEQIISRAIDEANRVRAAIRLPLSQRARMVFSVADTSGEVLGLFRMADATIFSIDVAVAKARNTAYFADPTQLVAADFVDDNNDGNPEVPVGAAFTNRTFRFISEPRFPDGVDANPPGPFSILNHPTIDPSTGENYLFDPDTNAPVLPAPASSFQSVLGFDAFNPSRNMHNPNNLKNQNGTVFFPGSTPLYVGELLVGGLGVSGDGVDQDDVVTAFAQEGFGPPQDLRADSFFLRDVRLPYQKFLRNPHG